MGRALAVIPARLSSSRLPRKLLHEVGGKPLVLHTLERVRAASLVGDMLVATADEEIATLVRAHGFLVVETTHDPRNGTERVWEAVRDRSEDRIVNVQADEILIEPSTVDAVIAALDAAEIATAAAPLEGADDESVVKVVTGRGGNALYFSRAAIPNGGPLRQHVGIYAFRRDALRRCATLPPSPLEEAERLEQLRWLENGHQIRIVDVARASRAVNTTRDLDAIRDLLLPPT